MVREPVVAGQFYAGRAGALRKEVESYLREDAPRQPVLGAVVPHAGYIYSGEVAGAVYSSMEAAPLYVILGPNHTGMGAPVAVMSSGSWRTPLGEVPIAGDLARVIMDGCREAEEDGGAHAGEHSIEVQLPFLQVSAGEFSFVPIALSERPLDVYRELGGTIAAATREVAGPVVILASSDMTHYESAAVAKKQDKAALEAIEALDEELLVRRVRDRQITMCGCAAVAVMLAAVKGLGATSAKLVRYMTSGDRTGDQGSVVGYAGVVAGRD